MTTPQTIRRQQVKRSVAVTKRSTATEAIGTLAPGMELYCLTFGQFSLIDALEHLIEQAGPCDVVVSTWTAAVTDAERAESLLHSGAIRRFRLLVDRSFIARQPGYCARVTELFGAEAIRTTRTHAKFALVTNDQWSLVVRTSMNLNSNPRLENIEISDDAVLSDFMLSVVESLWDEAEPGATVSFEEPGMAGVRLSEPQRGVAMGRIATVGKALTTG